MLAGGSSMGACARGSGGMCIGGGSWLMEWCANGNEAGMCIGWYRENIVGAIGRKE